MDFHEIFSRSDRIVESRHRVFMAAKRGKNVASIGILQGPA
jgi:hypothetical protein